MGVRSVRTGLGAAEAIPNEAVFVLNFSSLGIAPHLGVAIEAMMTDQSKLQIAEHQQGEVSVLTLSGELTLDDGDLAFGRYVDQMITAGRDRIVVDLSGVTYIDSAGVGMLVAESKRVAQHGGAIRLARLTARSYHLFAMLKLKVVFEIYDDVEAAVRSFAWRPR